MPFVDRKDMWWNTIDRQLQSLRQPRHKNYSLTERGITRHGAWEWVFTRQDEESRLTRYVVVAFTPVHTTLHETALFDLNLWAGADTENRFTRVWVSSDRLQLWGLQHEALDQLMKDAFARAEQLSWPDLDHDYPRLRNHPPVEAAETTGRSRHSVQARSVADPSPTWGRMTRGSWRRRFGSDTWHFCMNCTNWPTSDYTEERDRPRSGALCNECVAKERRGNCSHEERPM